MPNTSAFGYEYLLTIGIPKELIQLSVPHAGLASAVTIATAAAPTTPENISGTDLLDDRLDQALGKPAAASERKKKKDFRTVPSQFFDIVDKQLQAEIDNSKDSGSPATLRVYNLTDEQLNLVKENSNVILRAGYRSQISKDADGKLKREELPLIYVGEIISAITEDNGTDKITEIICSEGRTPLRNIKISLSWPPGTTRQEIILSLLDICSVAGLPLGRFEGDTSGPPERRYGLLGRKLRNGYQVSGLLTEVLEQVAAFAEYRMYLSVGKMYWEPLYFEDPVEVVNLTSENIKGTINREEDGSTSLSGSQNNVVGISLRTFLNGNIGADKFLRLSNLRNPEFEGDYKITSVSHVLDYEGNAWETQVSATRV